MRSMAGPADAYEVETELKKIMQAINNLSSAMAKLDSRVAALEKAHPPEPR